MTTQCLRIKNQAKIDHAVDAAGKLLRLIKATDRGEDCCIRRQPDTIYDSRVTCSASTSMAFEEIVH